MHPRSCRENRIPDEQWNAALDLIYDQPARGLRSADAFHRSVPRRPDAAAATPQVDDDESPIEEKLKQHIIDGEKRRSDRASRRGDDRRYPPLEIINNILLEGMKVVGELFGSGQMQLPFVLQSAETMKAAVAHLEPYMEKVEGSDQGQDRAGDGARATCTTSARTSSTSSSPTTATRSYNLGIKQPVAGHPHVRANEKKADAIGMSGLLVKIASP